MAATVAVSFLHEASRPCALRVSIQTFVYAVGTPAATEGRESAYAISPMPRIHIEEGSHLRAIKTSAMPVSY